MNQAEYDIRREELLTAIVDELVERIPADIRTINDKGSLRLALQTTSIMGFFLMAKALRVDMLTDEEKMK
jgi:hypothetical protein|tara:strand:+ start:5861 stop:6070 length:210 start_codon:yes stop_codon:yes gene_type:complete